MSIGEQAESFDQVYVKSTSATDSAPFADTRLLIETLGYRICYGLVLIPIPRVSASNPF